MDITKKLFSLRDEKYAEFQAKLTPNVRPEKMIGVRVPILRKLAKEYSLQSESSLFLQGLPHEYYDENMLHGLLIAEIKDFNRCMAETERFLPYIDNWAVCDIMSPKIFKKHKAELFEKIKVWTNSKHTYTVRFGVEMLMSHYLDDDFKKEYLTIPAKIKSDEYYVKMMVAWFFATALAKKWDDTIGFLEKSPFDDWTYNKIIQKACESYRISDSQKKYLRTLKK